MLVLKAHSNSGVACADNDTLIPVHFRRRIGRALAGDHVRLDAAGAVTEILPRKNVFGRGAWKGKFQALAANLDQLLIVVAPEPAPGRLLLHRYLAAAHILDIPACIVVNKTDLHDERLNAYLDHHAPDTEIVRISATGGTNLNALKRRLAGKVSLLAGQSGVGKTSLANALVPNLAGQTAALSRVTGKGTHTTSVCELHRLPDGPGGWLADSPGVWEYHLWQMDHRTLEAGFPEFVALPDRCRFNDCRHNGEPGCAPASAAQSGNLPAARLDAWRRLLEETARPRP